MSVIIRAQAGIEPAINQWAFSGFGDPSMLGLAAAVGSTYTQLDSNPPGDEWTKTGTADTAWTLQLTLPTGTSGIPANEVSALAGTNGTPSGTNPYVTSSDPRLPTASQALALVGTSGTPSGTNQYVTTADPRLAATSGGQQGMYSALVNGLVGDGVTDDAPALSTLANTTIGAGGGTIYFTPGHTYRLATAITVPAKTTLWIPNGALLSVDTVTVQLQGPILAELWQIFTLVNGGLVAFNTTNYQGANARVVAVPWIYPEWWGAKANGANDDSTAIQLAINAASGYPIPNSPSTRECGPQIRLSAGVYFLKHALEAEDVTGLNIQGAGMSNTYLEFSGGEAGTATGGTTTTLVNTAKNWATNTWADGTWFVVLTGGTGAGERAQITGNTATTLTLSPALATAPDATTTYHIETRGVLLLNGVFTSQFAEFQINGLNGYWKHGVVYYRDLATSARGSSQCRFTNVGVYQGYSDSGWQFGGGRDLSADQGYQADLCTLVGCQAFGVFLAATAVNKQTGFRFGGSDFANSLKYPALGCEAVGNKYNIVVSATNVAWYGGTVQTAWSADIFINQ